MDFSNHLNDWITECTDQSEYAAWVNALRGKSLKQSELVIGFFCIEDKLTWT